MVKVLVTNDDGIDVHGLTILVEALAQHADVYVVAPKEQQSGKSHSITFMREVTPEERDVKGAVAAWVLDGTPADCIVVACRCLPAKPDIVFSGINHGENAGIDVLYSGTVGAAMEALVQRIPAIAFSLKWEATGYELVDQEIDGIIEKLLTMKIDRNKIWNVNFPAHTPDTFNGILWDRVPSQRRYREPISETEEVENADRVALDEGYISIGTITSMALVP